MGPEVEFIMLPFIMFDYTPRLGLRKFSNLINSMYHPVLKLKKEGKRRTLDFGPNL